ncbi:MAG: c-type cytochrome [Roseiarcus sp.]
MRRLIVTGLLVAIGAGAVLADGDSIKQRRALMKADGEATRTVVGMLKGAPFDLAVVQAALRTFGEAAAKTPALFPDDSKTGDTNALPAIWDNKADFNARYVKFGADAAAALAAITDEASFKAQMPGVLKNCGGCHELYRAKKS